MSSPVSAEIIRQFGNILPQIVRFVRLADPRGRNVLETLCPLIPALFMDSRNSEPVPCFRPVKTGEIRLFLDVRIVRFAGAACAFPSTGIGSNATGTKTGIRR